MRIALLAVVLVAVGCSGGDGGDTVASRRTATTQTRPAATTGGSDDRGVLDRLAGYLGADEHSRCVYRVADESPETSGGETVAAVARDVERLRHLRFRRLPKPRYLTGRALDRRLTRLLEEYPDEELAADGRTLIALGALPPKSDLETLVKRAYTGQVAGYYDPRNGELVVDSGADRKLDGIDRVTLAHELEHALADQRLRLPNAVRGAVPPDGSEDAAVAASALVEGDATLLMEIYALEHLSFRDALRSLAPAYIAEVELRRLPHVLRASLLFPYEEGARFVCDLHERGGWKAVDRAYRDPPGSSAEILFPERYGHAAVDPADPPGLGGAWRRIDRQAFGAADLLWLLQAPGGDEDRALADVRDRVAAWTGGEVHTWASGRRTAVALRLVDRRPGGALCASMKAWRTAARLEAEIRCVGRSVRVGIAPDARIAARLVSS